MHNFWNGFEKQAEKVSPMKKRIVVFVADWCNPCKEYRRRLAIVQQRFPRVPVEFVDIDDNRALATKFEVRTVPHTMIVRGPRLDRNTVVDEFVGSLDDKSTLRVFDKAEAP